MKEELFHFIKNELPIKGRWLDTNHEIPFLTLGITLLNDGHKLKKIKTLLENVYLAVAGEFGL